MKWQPWPLALAVSFVLFVLFQLALVAAVSAGFEGTDDPAYYEHGLEYGGTHQARGWKVICEVGGAVSGKPLALRLRPLDERGGALRGARMQVLVARPATRRYDKPVTVTENSPGLYQGSVSLPPGPWDVRVTVGCRGLQFEQSTRIVVARL